MRNIHSSLSLTVLERCYPKEVQELYDAMRRFARVVGPTEHDKFIESHAGQCSNQDGRLYPEKMFYYMGEIYSFYI